MNAAWLKKNHGVSLTEIVISTVILSVALLGILSVMSTAFSIFNRSATQLVLSNLAKAKAEEIASYMSGPHTLIDLFNRYNGETQTSNLRMADGAAIIPGNYANFTRTVSVSYVDIQADVPGALLSNNLELVPTGTATTNAMVTVAASKPNFGSVKLVVFFFV
jgi:Tfp pilus assembly protein PilV